MEVYNEQVCDLLEPTNRNLPLREDPARGVVIVAGLSDFTVGGYDEVLELLMKGQVNRKTESTKANSVSSRSHAILQFTVTHSRSSAKGNNQSVESKLSLIDLAGSERAHATQNSGVRLQESSNINKSLLALANCINALSERSSAANVFSPSKSNKKNTNVKYRDSKLTHLLKGSLEGNCNLVMIANVNPADSTHDDTTRTLNYANRAKNLKVKPIAKELAADPEVADRESELLLKAENDELRNRLAMLEQNAQQQSESEQQLLQALAQALGALNAAKNQSEVVGAIGHQVNHHSHAQGIAAAANSMMDVSCHSKYGGGFAPSGRDSTCSVVPDHSFAGHKRDSMSSNMDSAHGGGSYNTRSSIGSIVYGLDGESDDENRDDDGEGCDEDRRQSEGCKSRRVSTDSSPRGRSSDVSVKGRLSNGSTKPPLKGHAAKTSTKSNSHTANKSNTTRLSNGNNNRQSLPVKTRLSSDIIKQYEVLASVANPPLAGNNAQNENVAPAEAKNHLAPANKVEAAKPVISADRRASRSSFGSITIDPRFQYDVGSRDKTPPKQNFITRFLCGIKKK
jgi:hypothetical protein